MSKRIFLLVLSAILLICPISTYAADTQSVEEQKFTFLEALDIICGLEYDDSLLQREITKAGYINFIMNIAADKKYTDYYDESSLQFAQDMGLIASKDSIDENDTLSVNEAATIAIHLLGHELEAQNKGGYPSGYLAAASSHNLLKGVTRNGNLTYAHVINLLYNITEADCSKFRLVGKNNILNYSEAVNALEYFRDIYQVKGVVTDNGESSHYDDSGVVDDEVKIGENVYLKGNSKIDKLLGHYVIAYVKEGDDEDEVVYAWDKTKSIVTIDAENVESVTGNLTVLSYYREKDGRTVKNIKIKPDAAFMFNGIAFSGITEDNFKKEGTNIIAIDYDGDNDYDFVNLESYDTIIVEAVSVSSKKIYNEYTFDAGLRELDLSDYDEEDITFYKNGEKANITDIEMGDVLTVFRGPNVMSGKIDIYINNDSIEGFVRGFSQVDGEITIDDKKHEVSDLYLKAVAENDSSAKTISLGNKYIFKTDKDGKIVFVIATSGDEWIYAYPVSYKPYYDLEDYYIMNFFTEDGTWEKKRLAEKVRVNGVTRKFDNYDINGEITASLKKDIIGIKYNNKGEISHIQTPTDYHSGIDTELLNRDKNVNGKTFRYNDTTFSNYYYMDGNTKVFIVPSDDTDNKSLYRIGSNYSFKSNNTPSGTVTGYNRDEYYNLDMVLWSSKATDIQTVGTTLYMVKKKGIRVNADDEAVPYVDLASETYAGVSFEGTYENSGLENVEAGDMIQIHINSDGYVDNCTVLYDLSAEDTDKKAIKGSLGGEDYTIQGFVSKKDCEKGRILVDTTQEVAFKLPASKPVLIYGGEEMEKVDIGTIDDIDRGDFVVVNVVKNQTSIVAVYKGLK